jgi:hypothetical protein
MPFILSTVISSARLSSAALTAVISNVFSFI